MTNEHENMKRFEYGYRCNDCGHEFPASCACSTVIAKQTRDEPADCTDGCPARECGSPDLEGGWYDNEDCQWLPANIFERLCSAVLYVRPIGIFGWQRVEEKVCSKRIDENWCKDAWREILKHPNDFDLKKETLEKVLQYKNAPQEVICNG
jgi:hypothetical protein